MKLFLASYFKQVAQLFPDFVGGNVRGKRVAFIPTASLTEKITFYVDADRKALQKLGMIVEELEISTADKCLIASALQQCDYIFIAGGNTFFLLQELRRTGTDVLLKEQIAGGKIYIGSSAGSVVLAPDIEYVSTMDNAHDAPLLTDFAGLGVVDFCLLPHYGNFPFAGITRKIVAEYPNVRTINNNQAIAVKGSSIEIVENRR